MIRFLLKSTNEYRYAIVGITYERRDRSGVNVSHLLIKKRRSSEASTMAEKDVKELIKPYRVKDGKGFRLKDIDPGDTGGLKSEQKKESREWLQHGVEKTRSGVQTVKRRAGRSAPPAQSRPRSRDNCCREHRDVGKASRRPAGG